MRRTRLPLAPLILALVVALGAACRVGPERAATSPPAGGAAPVVEVRHEGRSALLAGPVALPSVLVTRDGRVVSDGPIASIYPGPLLPNTLVQRIGPGGVERIVERARRVGLLREVTYAPPSDDRTEPAVATVVTLRVGGRTFVHRAVGLALGEADPGRARLEGFLESLDGLGQRPPFPTGFVPERYLVTAVPADQDPPDLPPGTDFRPTVVHWPAAAGVRLAGARTCTVVPAAGVREALTRATTLTWFRDGGVVYSVAAVPEVPGTGCGG